MNILLVGNGGRENVLAWKIYNSSSFQATRSKIFNTTGNPGIDEYAEPVNIKPNEIQKLLQFAEEKKIDFTIVGPEIPLSSGIVNEFVKNGFTIFGPKKEAAEIESSKVFAKKLMYDNSIPTAKYENFSKNNSAKALEYISGCKFPVVIKADGLAAGKGVTVVKDIDEAKETLKLLCEDKVLGDAGLKFIIEEFLEGEEVSVFVITDGTDFVILPFSQDHKKISEAEGSKNTGGMGAVAPLKKFMNEDLERKIRERIIEPTLKSLKNMGREFRGCLYCGLMIVNREPYVIEFNCRFGDPETQAVLPLIESDFLNLLLASANRDMKNYKLEINDLKTCCVVMASEGYPDKFETGKEITGLNEMSETSLIFHSGTKISEAKKILSNGGRVLSVVGISKISLEDAIKNAYQRVTEIKFENEYHREDIGFKQMKVKS